MYRIYDTEIRPLLGESKTAFARVYRLQSLNLTIIQYWFFYYDNPWWNHHEGDWEMVQVILNVNGDPVYVDYAQHDDRLPFADGGSKRVWADAEKVGVTHPVVYTALGSHASYFKPYIYRLPFQNLGLVDYTIPHVSQPITPTINMLPVRGNYSTCNKPYQWPCFLGHWGAEGLIPLIDQDGGPSPARQGQKWDNPWEWHKQLPFDEDAHHNRLGKLNLAVEAPLDLSLSEQPSAAQTIGIASMDTVEITSYEYFDNPDTGRRTIIVHEVYPNTTYEAQIVLRPDAVQAADEAILEPATVRLYYPDLQASTVITAIYSISVTWGISTTGTILISHDSDLSLMMDMDGDGATDQLLAPTVYEETSIDFTPPAAITDLSTLPSGPGSVTLTWTAPGDDGGAGTATAYDIRYFTTPITDSNWVSATLTVNLPVPSIAGTREVSTLTAVPPGVFYIAIRTIDDQWQWSGLSNVVEVEVPYGIYLPVTLRK